MGSNTLTVYDEKDDLKSIFPEVNITEKPTVVQENHSLAFVANGITPDQFDKLVDLKVALSAECSMKRSGNGVSVTLTWAE